LREEEEEEDNSLFDPTKLVEQGLQQQPEWPK